MFEDFIRSIEIAEFAVPSGAEICLADELAILTFTCEIQNGILVETNSIIKVMIIVSNHMSSFCMSVTFLNTIVLDKFSYHSNDIYASH
jgi:hypothetical protein